VTGPARAVKRSVSFAIFRPDDRDQVLVVQRPPDDEDLPDAWGLPAGSLRPGEDWADAARRAGRDKLGVELAVDGELNRGSIERAPYTLEMRLLEARIVAGEARVPQSVAGVTQYQAWRWGTAEDLVPAAKRGSLCSRLFLGR
jgi:ADP-ribose pyrophosphatase YjhB (NUDIX family)